MTDSDIRDLAGAVPAEDEISPIREALLEVVKTSMHQLPDEATLGELFLEIEQREELRPVLEVLTVQHLLEWGKARTRSQAVAAEEPFVDEDGNVSGDFLDQGAPTVVRRKADVEEGNLAVLAFLSKAGSQTELSISRGTRMDAEQVRLVVRHLRNKGLVHVEGSGARRRNRITRAGSQWLKKQRPSAAGGAS